MLPSELLRAKISKGKLRPAYVEIGLEGLQLAGEIVKAFEESVGKRKGDLMERAKQLEPGNDYKLVRGLYTLLERRCEFRVASELDPRSTRLAAFEEASRARATSAEARESVMRQVAERLGASVKAVEDSMYADLDEELVLGSFDPVTPERLIKQYNLSLTQTLLFKCVRMELTASENWQEIFRTIKRLGLMYSAEQKGGEFVIALDGPFSLFKMTDRYGTSLAKLIPSVVTTKRWRIEADILNRTRGKVYKFEASSEQLEGLMESYRDARDEGDFDSSVEERFARSFAPVANGWEVRREPEPLISGDSVFIPDFGFQKEGLKVYLEIVGFWTAEYVERKVKKLNALQGTDLLVAVDENLACSKMQQFKGKVFYYSRTVPVKPVVDHLRERERTLIDRQAKGFDPAQVKLAEPVVSVSEIARQQGIATGAATAALEGRSFEGYRRVGDSYIREASLAEIGQRLGGVEKLTEALTLIESYGVREPGKVLDSLGYETVWEGIDAERARIAKRKPRGQ